MTLILIIIFGGAALVKAKSEINELSPEVSALPIAKTTISSTEISKQISDTNIVSDNQKVLQDDVTQLFSITTPSPTPLSSPSATSNLLPTPIPTRTSTPTPASTSTPALPKLAMVEIQNLGDFSVEVKDNETAFSLLIRASQENNFGISYQNYGDLGAFIDCIGEVCGGDNNKYWMFYYNGQLSGVGASSRLILAGDITTWKFE
jgi:hypothetical protein